MFEKIQLKWVWKFGRHEKQLYNCLAGHKFPLVLNFEQKSTFELSGQSRWRLSRFPCMKRLKHFYCTLNEMKSTRGIFSMLNFIYRYSFFLYIHLRREMNCERQRFYPKTNNTIAFRTGGSAGPKRETKTKLSILFAPRLEPVLAFRVRTYVIAHSPVLQAIVSLIPSA